MDAPGKTVLIAANPKSGTASSAERVQQLKSKLDGLGLPAEIIGDLGYLQQRASQLATDGKLRCVVSAGGDGTVSAVANLLDRETPILVFPLGTENLLAKHYGLTTDIEKTAECIVANRQTTMDVGLANGKLFLVMLSVGFDALVVQHMTAIRRGHINRWSYARPIIGAMSQYKFPKLNFRVDGVAPTGVDTPQSGPAWLFVFNVPRYAANLQFCPQADPSDGRLDLCTFARRGLMSGLGYFSQLWLGRHQSLAGFQHRRIERIEIDAAGDGEPEIPYQIDGDFGGVLPLNIQIAPSRLRLIITDAGNKHL
ncbi:MAG: diacylglycerol kinase family protein [Aureliella sp.]